MAFTESLCPSSFSEFNPSQLVAPQDIHPGAAGRTGEAGVLDATARDSGSTARKQIIRDGK